MRYNEIILTGVVKMKEKARICDGSNHFWHEQDVSVYHVGKDKIRLFSTIDDFVSEKVCIALSKLETKALLLPRYPVYEKETYVGCATKWKEEDWIFCFMGKGRTLKRSLEQMREELLYLTHLGYDIGQMPYYCSYTDGRRLVFDGTYRIRKSSLSEQELEQRNNAFFLEYIRSLVYNGMSEFTADSELVYDYLHQDQMDLFAELQTVLDKNDMASLLIKEEMKRKVKK